jgi:hypothetical protein
MILIYHCNWFRHRNASELITKIPKRSEDQSDGSMFRKEINSSL